MSMSQQISLSTLKGIELNFGLVWLLG